MTSRPLSNREKWLAIIVGAAVALFAVLFLVQSFLDVHARLRGEIASREKQLRLMQMVIAQSAESEGRDAWLQSAQPRLTNTDSAGVALLNQVKDVAQKNGVLLQNHVIRPPEPHPEYVAVTIEVESISPWKSLIDFQYDLQNPRQFIALESTNLSIDASDSTKMRGRFKIARWYAPH